MTMRLATGLTALVLVALSGCSATPVAPTSETSAPAKTYSVQQLPFDDSFEGSRWGTRPDILEVCRPPARWVTRCRYYIGRGRVCHTRCVSGYRW